MLKRSDPLRLAVVSDYDYPAGGVEQFVREFLFHSKACDCRLVTWTNAVLRPPGFTNLELVEHGDIRGLWTTIEWADVVLVVTSFNVRLLAHAASEVAHATATPQITVVQTSSHSDPATGAAKTQGDWLARILSMSRRVVAVSEAVAQALTPMLDRVHGASPTVVVIENAARLQPSKTIRRARSRVTFMGRPFPQKGFDLFLRLAADLQGHGLTFHANTVSVPLPTSPPNVSISTLLSDDQLLRFFEETDLMVVPYRRADGLPMAVLEALNCGVPIIGMDSPAVTPLLKRFDQPVVEHRYEALRDAVRNWRYGRIQIAGPPPGQVAAWNHRVLEYVELATTLAPPQDA